MTTRPSAVPNNVAIEWDRERGAIGFFGIDSVLFWTDPSMYRLLCPLVDELGPELFRLLVAHASSLGTDTDYEVMVTKLGRDFVSGFLAWGEAVAGAGWGRFEVLSFDAAACRAHVRVTNPWEVRMQGRRELRWGCPFLTGKIIGIFSHAFGRPCWADEDVVYGEGARLDLHVHPSDRELASELEVLRRSRLVEREADLVRRIDVATAELRGKLDLIDRQRETIARLSCPILQVWDGVLAAVLVGELGDAALQDLTVALLERIQAVRARHVILDCTGMLALDEQQVAGLGRLVAAQRLLGARPVLVGLSPGVAAALAEAGDLLRGTPTLQTLADALRRAVDLTPRRA